MLINIFLENSSKRYPDKTAYICVFASEALTYGKYTRDSKIIITIEPVIGTQDGN